MTLRLVRAVFVLCTQHNDLGRRLCHEIINDQDSTTVKSRIKQLGRFYRNMPCLVELANTDRFEWTADELLQLTSGGIRRRVVSTLHALHRFIDVKTLQKKN